MYKVFYTKRAVSDLEKIESKTTKRIIKKIKFFSVQQNPLEFAKKLTNFDYGEYRFRVGDYRIIFDIDKQGNVKILMILTVKHRKEAYLP